jgi:hypothetical protein
MRLSTTTTLFEFSGPSPLTDEISGPSPLAVEISGPLPSAIRLIPLYSDGWEMLRLQGSLSLAAFRVSYMQRAWKKGVDGGGSPPPLAELRSADDPPVVPVGGFSSDLTFTFF